MSLNKINARHRLKRSIITGSTPTFNTQEDFTDGTFLTTDIRPGEFFYNTVDNRLFIANATGLTELKLYATGGTSVDANTFTTGASVTNNVAFFDTNASLSAYSLDLSVLNLSGNTAATGITASNGITRTNNNFTLGGALTGDTTISATDNDFIINLGTGNTIISGDSSAGAQIKLMNYNASIPSYLAVEKGSVNMNSESTDSSKAAIVRANGAANPYVQMRYRTGVTVQDLTISSTLGMVITDQIDSKGLIYANDYSANYVDRSLVDKEYVNNHVSSAATGSGVFLPLTGSAAMTGAYTAQTIYIESGERIASQGDSNYLEINGTTDAISMVTGDGAIIEMTDAIDLTGTTSVNGINVLQRDWSFAVSDETSLLSGSTSAFTAYAPFGMEIQNVYASLNASGSTSSKFDINKNGTTILSTVITVDANEFHSSDAATPPVITGGTISQFDKLTIDIDQAGTGSKGAKIYIVYLRQ